jgi:hypothetical protein
MEIKKLQRPDRLTAEVHLIFEQFEIVNFPESYKSIEFHLEQIEKEARWKNSRTSQWNREPRRKSPEPQRLDNPDVITVEVVQ